MLQRMQSVPSLKMLHLRKCFADSRNVVLSSVLNSRTHSPTRPTTAYVIMINYGSTIHSNHRCRFISSPSSSSAPEKSETYQNSSNSTTAFKSEYSRNSNEETITYTNVKHIPTKQSAHSKDDEQRVKMLQLGQGITHVILSRPKKLNSLDMPMFEGIAEAAARLREDRDLRVVIMSGASFLLGT